VRLLSQSFFVLANLKILPVVNNSAAAAQVSNVYGIAKVGNSVFKLHIVSIGPSTTTIIIKLTPKISLNNIDVITKNPPKDKPTNNLLQLYSQSKHSSLDL